MTASTADTPGYSRREQIGWYFYDWANSAFSTTVVTVFLGPYLTAITKNAADANNMVYPLGIPVLADSFFPYIVSLSVVLQVFFLPILGAVADYSRLKKQLMGIAAYVGAIATIGLYFLQGRQLPTRRHPLPHCQPQLWRIHRLLQRLSQRDRQPR